MGVGHSIDVKNAGWTFGGSTPENFVEHIKQSVPLYEEGHSLTCQLSDFFVSDASVCYEIGVSTGELLKKLALHNSAKPNAKWIGLDPVEAMVETARAHCADVGNIQILHEDARVMEFETSDLIVSYYCMQFIPPRDRAYFNWSADFHPNAARKRCSVHYSRASGRDPSPPGRRADPF